MTFSKSRLHHDAKKCKRTPVQHRDDSSIIYHQNSPFLLTMGRRRLAAISLVFSTVIPVTEAFSEAKKTTSSRRETFGQFVSGALLLPVATSPSAAAAADSYPYKVSQ